jgi:hypothetical protein
MSYWPILANYALTCRRQCTGAGMLRCQQNRSTWPTLDLGDVKHACLTHDDSARLDKGDSLE